MKSHSHILRWSRTSRGSSSVVVHIGRSRSAQARRAGERSDSAEHSCERSMTGRPYRGDQVGPAVSGLSDRVRNPPRTESDDGGRPLYIRSKFRASSQSDT